jgi:hypothetical protein
MPKIIVAGLAFLLIFPECRAQVIEHSDGTFSLNDWAWEVVARPPGTTTGFMGEAVQAGNGQGNPDPYWRVEVSRTPAMAGSDNSTRLHSFHKPSGYDACFTGAIDSVDISLDGIQFGGGSGGGLSPILKQGGVLYVASGVSLPDVDWTLKSFPGLTENSFFPIGSPGVHPDFSAEGAPISFGFGYTVSTPSEQTVMRTVGFDNWEISVSHSAPPPFFINAGLNDAWFNILTVGQGFFFTVFPDISGFFLAWFTYDTERPDSSVTASLGEPGHRWLTAFGEYEGDTAVLDVELTSGGIFDSSDPVPMQQSAYGTITIQFHNCRCATLTYSFPSLGLMDVIPLKRIANDNVPRCEALSADLRTDPS